MRIAGRGIFGRAQGAGRLGAMKSKNVIDDFFLMADPPNRALSNTKRYWRLPLGKGVEEGTKADVHVLENVMMQAEQRPSPSRNMKRDVKTARCDFELSIKHSCACQTLRPPRLKFLARFLRVSRVGMGHHQGCLRNLSLRCRRRPCQARYVCCKCCTLHQDQ